MSAKQKPDYSKLDDDFKQKLESIKGQPVESQIQDIKTMTDRGFRALAQEMKLSEASQGDIINKMGEVLTQSQTALTELLKRPEVTPHDNKPLIDAISGGFDAMREDLGKIELKPEVKVDIPKISVPKIVVPKIDTPNVGVTVDTSAVAKVLKKLPNLFESAIQAIEPTDLTGLQESVDKSNELLKDVRKNTAFKPEAPTTLKVVNPNGSTVGGIQPGVDYDYIEVVQTSATVETYVFKTGGSGGDTVRTIVTTYTDSTRATISNVSYS